MIVPTFRENLALAVLLVALPELRILQIDDALRAAIGAVSFAILPAKIDNEAVAVIGIGEVDNGFLKCLGDFDALRLAQIVWSVK